MLLSLQIALFILGTLGTLVNGAPDEDKIKSLPGLDDKDFSKLGFQMYSGYVSLDDAKADDDAATSEDPSKGGRKIFYWFVSKDGAKDFTKEPTMLWTNGGPGCSGMIGFLTEQGPFRPAKDGKKLEFNDFAWNKLVNMVFIEQPVGVGFSQTDRSETYNDENAANDNRKFIVGFFKKFPELKNTPFYIASESYGGHYMPTLAKNILDNQGSVPNFKGLFVGNPLIWTPNNDLGEFETLAGHQVLPGPLVGSFIKSGCNNVNLFRFSPACKLLFQKSQVYKEGLDPYAMDFPICNDASAMKKIQKEVRKKEYEALLSSQEPIVDENGEKIIPDMPKIERRLRNGNSERSLQYFPDDYQPCEESYAEAYLNRADVQKALHALPPILGTFKSCNDGINIIYSRESFNANMIPIYESLMGKVKITIFSGDDDTVCATAGLQHWIWNYNVVANWKQWQVSDKNGSVQVGGYYASFSKEKGNGKADFHVYTVHGAGHMVPSTRPHAGFELLKKFLQDDA